MKQNTQPTLLERRSLTLKRKTEELGTHCEGNVQICPNKSDAAGKKRSHSSPKSKKQKVLYNAGEGVDDIESWADELEKLIPECTELLGVKSDEFEGSSQPIDTAGKGVDDIESWADELEKLIPECTELLGVKSDEFEGSSQPIDTAGKGVDDIESWADELEKLIPECTELLGVKSDEFEGSSQPIDTAGKGVDHHTEEIEKLPRESLMDIIDFLESKGKQLEEKINSIEGSKSTDQPDCINNCNSPLGLTKELCNDPRFAGFYEGKTILQACEYPGFDSGFGTSTSSSPVYQNTHYPGFPSGIGSSTTSRSTNIDSGNDQWWELSTGIENYSTIFSSIGDESWIENHISLEGFEHWSSNEMMRMTRLEEHQSCESAAGTSGCTSTPFPCQSGKGHTDTLGFEAVDIRDMDQKFTVAPQPSPEVLLTNSLGPKHEQFHKNHELIIID